MLAGLLTSSWEYPVQQPEQNSFSTAPLTASCLPLVLWESFSYWPQKTRRILFWKPFAINRNKKFSFSPKPPKNADLILLSFLTFLFIIELSA